MWQPQSHLLTNSVEKALVAVAVAVAFAVAVAVAEARHLAAANWQLGANVRRPLTDVLSTFLRFEQQISLCCCATNRNGS